MDSFLFGKDVPWLLILPSRWVHRQQPQLLLVSTTLHLLLSKRSWSFWMALPYQQNQYTY